jgi:uncharacterized membrane protein
LIGLRILHIVGGTAWVGGAIIYHLFLEPTAKAATPGSQQFMQYFIVRRRYPVYMTVSSLAVNLSGVLLFWRSSGGLTPNWITSGPGLVFSLGSVLAIIAFGMGMFILSPTAKRLMGLGQALQAAGGPPLPEQMSELHHLEKTMNQVGWTEFALMLVSLLTMAVARYWWF